MFKIGMKVKVHYPDYAASLEGKLLSRENSARWIVKLNKNHIDRYETLLLSLEASEFEALDSHHY